MRGHIYSSHKEQVLLETDLFFGCPAQMTEGCEAIAKASTNHMVSHVTAMHPLLCGKPEYSGNALQKRMDLVIKMDQRRVRVGETLDGLLEDCVESNSDKKMQRYLWKYLCPDQDCSVMYWVRDYMVWHIGADHQPLWNTA
ncbi:uncharacterized protein LOC129592171 [Paramacrobiotus metropolitanus]|uniref:uncharacterized protein LOC129592171 n=1 Tax=Paramacrobiotus metropolitanus TaxID=2943436 RepID=UPI0024464030|nr:uncharacterized protein LOC129592171 [Paramacrobiotus metropolitanus]